MMESYVYIEHNKDTLPMQSIIPFFGLGIKPVMWAQEGRYGWISKEQIMNMIRREKDQTKQLKGYMKNKPIDLVFHWDDTVQLDPITVGLMRTTSQ